MEHHFNTDVAKEYGINCAVLLNHFVFWQKENEANRRNYHEGRYWSYNTIKAFTEMFNYLSTQNIRTAIRKLMDAEILIAGEFSDDPYDHTKYYSVTDKGMKYYQFELLESTNLELLPTTNRIVSSNKSTIRQLKNNTDNNTDSEKRKYGEFQNVLLTDNELQKLKDRFPSTWERWIQRLDEYIESKGTKYKSHYATILTWARKDDKKGDVLVLGTIHY